MNNYIKNVLYLSSSLLLVFTVAVLGSCDNDDSDIIEPPPGSSSSAVSSAAGSSSSSAAATSSAASSAVSSAVSSTVSSAASSTVSSSSVGSASSAAGNTMGGYTWEQVGGSYADDVTTSVSTSGNITTITIDGAVSYNDGDSNGYATTGDGVDLMEDFSSASTISYTVDNQTATNIQVTVAIKTGTTWEWWEGHYNPDSGTEIAAGTSDTYTLSFSDANDWKSDVTGWSYGVSAPADLNDVHEIIFKVMIPEDGAGPVSGDVAISGLTIN
ncbi:MAG TPA: hypothetical protein VKS21_11040 [Spirochaetota bacterium]|nr:hypothetical protein [Spirochaetota bacterium]